MEVLPANPIALASAEGGQAVVEAAATGVVQARHLALQRDAEGAINILRRLDTPAMREYRALHSALHSATAVGFVTQQCMGLGVGMLYGTGMVLKRLDDTQSGLPLWSAPFYFKIRAGVAALVAGYEYVQTLLVFNSERELQRFVGECHIGANFSMIAGSNLLRHLAARPRRVDVNKSQAAMAFSVAAGAMLNISLQVGWTSAHDKMNRSLFGDVSLFGTTPTTPEQLLSGEVPPPAEFATLYMVLRRYAAQRPWA